MNEPVRVPGIIRAKKWCPAHGGEYEGNTWAGVPPIAALVSVRDADGRVVGICDLCIDEAERKLRESEAVPRAEPVHELRRPERTGWLDDG